MPRAPLTTDPLAGPARAAAEAGERDPARTLAIEAEHVTGTITNPNQQAQALAQLARAILTSDCWGRTLLRCRRGRPMS
ncbi:hypothetical protein [Virgisporangium aurantiacum]|uniref:Uncharacterized protein n=1 Tax=Virgisporangium aurantiacum TaxID=175570 RepID=A0A8J3ZF48_9ACTN|nr:hypothetical protein [Virgisporangium aurantiacum]GIJ63004.1 hypothetical protein Vau01_105200 [Virgisporangium aurantiacum]